MKNKGSEEGVQKMSGFKMSTPMLLITTVEHDSRDKLDPSLLTNDETHSPKKVVMFLTPRSNIFDLCNLILNFFSQVE